MVICYGGPRNRTCIISLERFQPNFPSVYSVLRGLLIVSQDAQLPWFRPHLPAPRRLHLEFSLQFPSWGETSVFSNPRPEPQPRDGGGEGTQWVDSLPVISGQKHGYMRFSFFFHVTDQRLESLLPSPPHVLELECTRGNLFTAALCMCV